MPSEFRNEPFTDFSKEENAQAMRDAIQKVQAELGREYPLVIGGERITTEGKLDSYNPANRTQLVGRFNKATKELASRAVESAAEAFKTVEDNTGPGTSRSSFPRCSNPARTQARVFSVDDSRSCEDLGRSRWRHCRSDRLSASSTRVKCCVMAGGQPLVANKGEDNKMQYIPLGVGAVIPPWNFPLAIYGGDDNGLGRYG
jgi:1-pyrroline-5-carboxylate dehydrogenase